MVTGLKELTDKDRLIDTYTIGAAVARIAQTLSVVITEIDLLRDRVKALSALPVVNQIAPENFTGKVIKIDGQTCRVLRHDVYLRDHWYIDHGDGVETSVSEAVIRKALGKQS
jgi:hypothetical protein